MVKEKRILSYFIGWLLLGFIVCFVGVNKIFALQNNNGIWFYDNSGTSANEISTSYTSEIDMSNATFTTVANSYGGLVVIQVDKPLIKDHIYTLFLNVGAESNGGSTKKSTKNCLGISNSRSGAVNSYINCSITPEYSQDVGVTTDKGRGLYFTFIANADGAYLSIPYTTQYTCNNCLQYSYGYNIEDAGNSNNLSQDEVNSIINNQTNIIQNDINNMQQSIVDSNKETQEVIKDQFNSCRPSVNIANITSSTDYNFTIGSVENGKTYTLSFISNSSVSFHIKNSNDEIITSRYGFTGKFEHTFQSNGTIQILFNGFGAIAPNITKIQLQEGSVATSFEEPNTEICSNKIDETNDKLDGIQGALTDSSAPNTSGLENSAGWLPAGPLDSILNLPLTMLNSLTNSLGKTCSPLNLTLPYVNKQLQIPCLSSIFAKITGVNGLWTWVGTIASVLILYNYLLNLYAWVDRILTLRAEFDEAMGADLANWGRL